jgi:membrane protein YqaA with SNARE-associated domain
VSLWEQLFGKKSLLKKNGALDYKHLVIKTILVTAFALALVFVGIHVLSSRSVNKSAIVQKVYETLGYKGVALFVFVVDTLIVPMTVDVMWPFVVQWNALNAISLMGIASGLGGFCGYLLGMLLDKIPVVTRWTNNIAQSENGAILKKYGIWAVVLAGITPIPFSTVCWVAGSFHLSWKRMLVACLASRLVRMTLYYFFVAATL